MIRNIVIEIDCEDETCGECSHFASDGVTKCDLFEHNAYEEESNLRLAKCIEAECRSELKPLDGADSTAKPEPEAL